MPRAIQSMGCNDRFENDLSYDKSSFYVNSGCLALPPQIPVWFTRFISASADSLRSL